jgi:hypothetical protein
VAYFKYLEDQYGVAVRRRFDTCQQSPEKDKAFWLCSKPGSSFMNSGKKELIKTCKNVMPYDEYLADRIRKAFRDQHVDAEEKKMMGGVCYLVNGKMCAGIVKNKLMARIDPEGTDTDEDLDYWIKLCMEYNPKAKASKKK